MKLLSNSITTLIRHKALYHKYICSIKIMTNHWQLSNNDASNNLLVVNTLTVIKNLKWQVAILLTTNLEGLIYVKKQLTIICDQLKRLLSLFLNFNDSLKCFKFHKNKHQTINSNWNIIVIVMKDQYNLTWDNLLC